jgi:hypothetical protein
MNATQLTRIAEAHSGRITAQDDAGVTRIQFENRMRAGGFYDEMTSRFVKVLDYNREMYFVTVQL